MRPHDPLCFMKPENTLLRLQPVPLEGALGLLPVKTAGDGDNDMTSVALLQFDLGDIAPARWAVKACPLTMCAAISENTSFCGLLLGGFPGTNPGQSVRTIFHPVHLPGAPV